MTVLFGATHWRRRRARLCCAAWLRGPDCPGAAETTPFAVASLSPFAQAPFPIAAPSATRPPPRTPDHYSLQHCIHKKGNILLKQKAERK